MFLSRVSPPQNDDPLKRIQQEINEVKQRELELRNQLQKQQLLPSGDPQLQQNSDDSGISTTSSSPINGTSANRDRSPSAARPHRFVDHNPPEPVKASVHPTASVKKKPIINPTYVRSTSAAAFVFAPRNPKPALPVEYYLKPHPVKPAPSAAAAKKNQSMLTRTVSTPQLFQSFQPKAPTRGFMQRFIETRGKMSSSAVAKVSEQSE